MQGISMVKMINLQGGLGIGSRRGFFRNQQKMVCVVRLTPPPVLEGLNSFHALNRGRNLYKLQYLVCISEKW